MHPITVIEFTFFAVFIGILFSAVFVMPKKYREKGIRLVSLAMAVLIVFFILRPLWVDYQVSLKTEQLNHYLQQRYPGEEWAISSMEGKQYNPYHFDVVFGSEEGWSYRYLVGNEKEICQLSWGVPDKQPSTEGEHYEGNNCE